MPTDTSPAAHARRAARFNAACTRDRTARHGTPQSSVTSTAVIATPSTPPTASSNDAYEHWVLARAQASLATQPAKAPPSPADPKARADAEAQRILTTVFGPSEPRHAPERTTRDPEAERILASVFGQPDGR